MILIRCLPTNNSAHSTKGTCVLIKDNIPSPNLSPIYIIVPFGLNMKNLNNARDILISIFVKLTDTAAIKHKNTKSFILSIEKCAICILYISTHQDLSYGLSYQKN